MYNDTQVQDNTKQKQLIKKLENNIKNLENEIYEQKEKNKELFKKYLKKNKHKNLLI